MSFPFLFILTLHWAYTLYKNLFSLKLVQQLNIFSLHDMNVQHSFFWLNGSFLYSQHYIFVLEMNLIPLAYHFIKNTAWDTCKIIHIHFPCIVKASSVFFMDIEAWRVMLVVAAQQASKCLRTQIHVFIAKECSNKQ